MFPLQNFHLKQKFNKLQFISSECANVSSFLLRHTQISYNIYSSDNVNEVHLKILQLFCARC